MEVYNPTKIELKWQKYWEKKKLYQAKDNDKKPKFFLLVEFPYPSGAGLHVGHCRSFIAMDIIARKRRMQGYNVLFPMGWDAFGLPTENFAIKTGKHPAKVTKENTAVFKKQEKSLGLSFNWDREINTADPVYYKYTQWIFLKMFEKGLAYKAKMPINWCLSCKIGLANEEVIEGKCERCGGEVEKRDIEQWMLKITKYADRLLKDLDKVDFPERVKALQRDWIGKSQGWEIKFKIKTHDSSVITPQNNSVQVFTTRIDTLFGCTYLVLSSEHPILEKINYKNKEEVVKYIKQAKGKQERERLVEQKEKTGVKLEGVMAINPANNKEIPIFIADYVIMGYGTGAIMAVPAHDSRDMIFAKKFNLPIVKVISPPELGYVMRNAEDIAMGAQTSLQIKTECWTGEGKLINSGDYNGMDTEEAKEKIGAELTAKGAVKKKINYKLRDWVFSRQRYWGEPIPLVYCQKCGWQAVEEKDLPIELPSLKDFKPTDDGQSPLSRAGKWLKTKCPKCQGEAKRETDVMPNWAGSNWYFLRYCDPHNKKEFASAENLKYWMPVDWYNGGMEHTTLHLLYSRFVYKFLWDIGAVPKELGEEPYKKRTSHGMILAEGGVKMSKSKGNVISPDEVIKEHGADTLRIYEMFMGPFSQAIAWDIQNIKGSKRFLENVWNTVNTSIEIGFPEKTPNSKLRSWLEEIIEKVSEDIENMKFNTAISAMMGFVGFWWPQKDTENILLNKIDTERFLTILAPFSPHIVEELWQRMGNKKSIFLQKWPKPIENLLFEKTINLIIQVNGKVRDIVEVETGLTKEQARDEALKLEKIKIWLKDHKIKKVIFVENKLINFVI